MILWTITSNASSPYATLSENEYYNIPIPVIAGCTVKLISGTLPPGIRLVDNIISGTPASVSTDTDYVAILRAELDDQLDDCSFMFRVTGKDIPVWVTPPGYIYPDMARPYVIDGSVIDYQFVATDRDEQANEQLRYYVSGGELPEEVVLLENGKLTGTIGLYVSPTYPATEVQYYPFPYPSRGEFTNNKDSDFYDTSSISMSLSTIPLRVSRTYTFEISVYDGKTIPVPRTFMLHIWGNDTLRADTTLMAASESIVYSDISSLRLPEWISTTHFGYFRGNNNITLYLDVYDPTNATGYAKYTLLPYSATGEITNLPSGLTLDENRGILQGYLPSATQNVHEYTFTVRATSLTNEYMYSDKTFYFGIKSYRFSNINWITDDNLGTLRPYQISLIKVDAVSSNTESEIIYKLESGQLPPGLQLSRTGEIIGQINPYSDSETHGLTYIDAGDTQLDNNETTIDREFNFTINASNNTNLVGTSKSFKIYVDEPENIIYTDIIMRPYMNEQLRDQYYQLISDHNVFESELVFRRDDPMFGRCVNPEVILYSGLEANPLDTIFSVIENLPRMRFKIEAVNVAQAHAPGTRKILYEVVYLQVSDPREHQYNVRQPNTYNLSMVREQLYELGNTDLRLERLWMRSLQNSTGVHELGYTLAIPLVYCVPGAGVKMLTGLRYSQHNVYEFDLDIDRVVVRRSPTRENEQYVMFNLREPVNYV